MCNTTTSCIHIGNKNNFIQLDTGENVMTRLLLFHPKTKIVKRNTKKVYKKEFCTRKKVYKNNTTASFGGLWPPKPWNQRHRLMRLMPSLWDVQRFKTYFITFAISLDFHQMMDHTDFPVKISINYSHYHNSRSQNGDYNINKNTNRYPRMNSGSSTTAVHTSITKQLYLYTFPNWKSVYCIQNQFNENKIFEYNNGEQEI